jgi:DNA-binding NarL/FixJ family response regulator
MNAEAISDGDQLAVLTPALRRVARLVALGASNAAVAAEVGVSEATVRTQLTTIYDRLGFTGQGRVKVRVRLAYLVGRWDREQVRQMEVTTR